MTKILLLGDSIRMGYQQYVKDMLEGECEVIYPDDNGRFATYTLWQLNQYLKHNRDIDLIHFNNGYWDMNIEYPMTDAVLPLDDYVRILERIVRLAKDRNVKIIFATTTPIREAEDKKTNYENAWVKEYNAGAVRLMESLGVPINDLYALCLADANCYKCDDDLHLTDEGYLACASQTVEQIRKYI